MSADLHNQSEASSQHLSSKTSAQAPPKETSQVEHINGIDTNALFKVIDQIKANPKLGQSTWHAKTSWEGGDLSRTHIGSWGLGGKENKQDFDIMVDEPVELLGTGKHPNPQQVLFASINTCIMNTFVVNAAVKGIRLEQLEIELKGDIDLRGFLGIDDSVPKGYEELNCVLRVKGDGTEEQFEELMKAACGHSPNYYTITHPVPINGRVEIISDLGEGAETDASASKVSTNERVA